MARIRIKDLPRDQKISQEEMRRVMGGFRPQPEPPARSFFQQGLWPGMGTQGVISDTLGLCTVT